MDKLAASITAIDEARRAKGNSDGRERVLADADHYTLAQAFVDALTLRHGSPPVYVLGTLWTVRDALWSSLKLDDAAVRVGEFFHGGKYCRRGADFAAIARIAANLVSDERFFDEAPIGVAGPGSFWRIGPNGEISTEPLAPAHRQRMRLKVEPDFAGEAPLWDRLLDHAFPPGTDDDRQRDLLQMLAGAALSRSLWKHRLAVLLLGLTTSGKSTVLNVLASLFPRDLIGATSPQKWGSEYYVAALAGKALNIVGELDPDQPIAGGAFKSIVGCDVVEGRHPTHRPFSFVCTAAHFFNANRLPPTVDKSDAFFRRWRIVHFKRTVPDEAIVVDLAEQIAEQEIGPVVAWMLEGATMLAVAGSIPETADHRRLVTKWRHANNSALQMLADTARCELDPAAETKASDLFEAYRTWAAANGVRAFGRNNFLEALEEGAGRLGVARCDRRDGAWLIGVRLV